MLKSIVFLYYDQDIVNGGFFDNFEYYYLTKKIFKEYDVTLRLVSDATKEEVFAFINDKYENIEDFIFDGIEVIQHRINMHMLKPPKIDFLVCATNSSLYWFFQNGGFIVAKDVIAMGDFLDHHPKYDKCFDRFRFFYDERIFNSYNSLDVWYRKKILFSKYRIKEFDSKYDYMMNMSLVERRFPRDFFEKLFNQYKGTYVIYTGIKNLEYYSWLKELEFVELIKPPVKNFMDLFKTFIYVPYNNGWDATPRLLPECLFYNKNIIYYDNDSEIKAGGYYRYLDCQYDYMSLFLDVEDKFFSLVEDIINV